MRHSLLLLFFLVPVLVFGQPETDKEKALALAKEAIALMDAGKVDESIELLVQAQKLDPSDILFPYEEAYAYYLLKEYKKANKILKELSEREDANSAVFQLLGNTYDLLDAQETAMETYESGLKRFPNAGNLYLEMGVVHMSNERLHEALDCFERGIFFDPTFPSNYYWAARFYLGSDEEVWGMLYGEIFMNLERGSPRTAEMSALLYRTYASEIQFNGESISVSFSKNSTVSLNDAGEMKLPFPMMAYEPTLMLALLGQTEVNLASLHTMRSEFIRMYYEGNLQTDYPNVLFDYQRTLRDLGYLEAYNYWLLMKGNEEEFNTWREAHSAAFEAFIAWYLKNPLELDADRRFHSSFY